MNPEHLEVVKQGAKAIEVWRAGNKDIRLDLSKANLTGADLTNADLTIANLDGAHLTKARLDGARLDGAYLTNAHLTGASLTGARLTGAGMIGASLPRVNLTGADLKWAHLNGADLTGADLTRVDLPSVDLTGARLTRADFTEARCGITVFANVDLSTVKGLETVKHLGPSTLGVDTLYRSGGKIPEVFLRGCGVPEEFIAYLPSLIGAQQAIQFYSCFISYSHKDEEFAKRLHGRLRDEGLRVWYAPEEMKGGQYLNEQIEKAIQVHDKLLLVISEESLASDWVEHELYNALHEEKRSNRRKLFPIRLVDFDTHIKEWKCFDADSGKDMAREVRKYFIPDFERWKDHDVFEAGMTRLLNDLRATETAKDPAA